MTEHSFTTYKNEITALLDGFILKKSGEYMRFPLDREIFGKLAECATRGKMLRGSILLYVFDLFSPNADRSGAVRAAAALELMEAGILIQDDVIDRDEKRRGLPAIWAHFRDTTGGIRAEDAASFGSSVAVCVGDVAYFLAYILLNGMNLPDDRKNAVVEAYAREMSALSLSQVQDLYLAKLTRDVSEEETLAMYEAKTARYSWVLPLETALILAGRRQELGVQFEKIGNSAGLVYQLIDDRIGLFGDEKKTGKPAGGDIREGKKTLYWHYARKLLTPADRSRFEALYGRRDIQPEDIEVVKELVRSSGAYDKAEKLMATYLGVAVEGISALPVSEEAKDSLREMIAFISARKI